MLVFGRGGRPFEVYGGPGQQISLRKVVQNHKALQQSSENKHVKEPFLNLKKSLQDHHQKSQSLTY